MLKKINFKNDFKPILKKLQNDLDNPLWIKCKCGKEWNRLTRNGICIDCEEERSGKNT